MNLDFRKETFADISIERFQERDSESILLNKFGENFFCKKVFPDKRYYSKFYSPSRDLVSLSIILPRTFSLDLTVEAQLVFCVTIALRNRE